MKILLTTLNAKYVHSCLALKYLCTAALNAGFDAEYREFTINNDMHYVYGELVRGDYDLIGFSCYIWNIEKIKELAADIKKACPRVRILLGGPEAGSDAVSFLAEHRWADWILRGEGEISLVRFLQCLESAGDLSRIGGLTYRREGRICENPQYPPVSPDQIPFPYSIFPAERDKVIYYESSRGCPYRCSYCLSSLEKQVRALPLERVERELSWFLKQSVRQVKFIDRTFNYDERRAYEIFKYLIDNDNGVTNFHFEICADLMSERIIALLSTARKGLFQLEIGIQSANPPTLSAVNRKENIYPILYNVEKLLRAGNIHIHVDLIAGLPYETYDLFARSFDKVYNLKADMFQMGFLKVLKGSPLWQDQEKFGIKARDKAPYEVISTKWLGAEELVRLKSIEKMLNIYYNRKGFSKTTDFLIESFAKTPFKLYEILADYYYEKGFQHRDRKKEDQYRILYGFCGEIPPQPIGETAKEKLCEDLKSTFNPEEVSRFLKHGWEI